MDRLVGFGLLGLMLFRLLVLAVLPLDLSGDEVYYWEWGRHLDWGYFSKPPGIAWLMALAGWVGGDTPFGIRMFAVFLGTAGLWFLYLLGRRLYDPQVGALATLIFALSPANAALNLTLTIDAPLMFCWMAALWSLWRFVESECRSWTWGTALTLSVFGGLLAKQMMLVFFPLAMVWLAVTPGYRHLLRRPGFWICFALSLTALLPPLYWNIQNDWLTVTHTMHHFGSGSPTLLRRLQRFLEFLGAVIALPTPVFGFLLFALVTATVFLFRRLGARERFLWVFCGTGLLGMCLMALRQRINANWPAVFLPAALVFLSAWILGHWRTGLAMDRWKRAATAGIWVAVACFVLTYGAVASFSLGWLPSPEFDPSRRIRGWSELGNRIGVIHSALPEPERTIYITQSHRFTTSELAFYLPDQPRVYRFHDNRDRIESQHDLWETPAVHSGKDALIVVEGGRGALHPSLAGRFDSITFLEELDLSEKTEPERIFGIYHGKNLRYWPE